MDPFSALTIATSVVQFIDFGCSLVSETRQIYKSLHGATVSQVETTFAARRTLELSERMKSSLRDRIVAPPIPPKSPELPPCDDSTPATKSKYEKELNDYDKNLRKYEIQIKDYPRFKQSLNAICDICDKCIALSRELEDRLTKLRVQGLKHRKFKSIQQALKSVWSADEIHDLEKRLESHRRELNDHLLAATW